MFAWAGVCSCLDTTSRDPRDEALVLRPCLAMCKAIARLNQMREVSTESLQRPIKLG